MFIERPLCLCNGQEWQCQLSLKLAPCLWWIHFLQKMTNRAKNSKCFHNSIVKCHKRPTKGMSDCLGKGQAVRMASQRGDPHSLYGKWWGIVSQCTLGRETCKHGHKNRERACHFSERQVWGMWCGSRQTVYILTPKNLWYQAIENAHPLWYVMGKLAHVWIRIW